MSKVGQKQPSEEKTFDIDLSNELKRSDETITTIISITDDQGVSLTYTSQLIIASKFIRVTIGGGVDGTTYKGTIQVVTNYSPVIEVEFYIVVVET